VKDRAASQPAPPLADDLERLRHAVAHDVRSPVRNAIGFLEMLAAEHAAGLDADGRDYLERARSAARRADTMLERLLEAERCDRMELRRSPIDIAALARATLAALDPDDPAAGLTFVADDALRCAADPALAGIVLRELLDNARKATASAGNTTVQLRRGAETPGEGPTFRLTDEGIGFDMAFAGRLFQPFGRLHALREFPGAGMGLAIARRIVERHGGRMRCEAMPGGGCTIAFGFGPDSRVRVK
jgi:signal transduction histidine kinase